MGDQRNTAAAINRQFAAAQEADEEDDDDEDDEEEDDAEDGELHNSMHYSMSYQRVFTSGARAVKSSNWEHN
jgi:hypothetical protein